VKKTVLILPQIVYDAKPKPIANSFSMSFDWFAELIMWLIRRAFCSGFRAGPLAYGLWWFNNPPPLPPRQNIILFPGWGKKKIEQLTLHASPQPSSQR